jgi:hypothetical protein
MEFGPAASRRDAPGRLSLTVGASELVVEYDAGAAGERPWLRRLTVMDGRLGGWLYWSPDGDDSSGRGKL